jgi:hypothetical protein
LLFFNSPASGIILSIQGGHGGLPLQLGTGYTRAVRPLYFAFLLVQRSAGVRVDLFARRALHTLARLRNRIAGHSLPAAVLAVGATTTTIGPALAFATWTKGKSVLIFPAVDIERAPWIVAFISTASYEYTSVTATIFIPEATSTNRIALFL